jgi:ring-1,2-phenylacetyl-CoA epoxidase subunit PaaB
VSGEETQLPGPDRPRRSEGGGEHESERTSTVRERARAADNARIGRSGQGLEPWEVFRQEKDGAPMTHGGNVLAPDAELALHYARELYARRNESARLWVVRRVDIHVLDDPDWLFPPLDRSYRKPAGFPMRDKLAAARETAGTAKPPARANAHDTTGRRTGDEP